MATTSTPTSELREKVYQLILRSGAAGLTDEELSKNLRVAGDILRPRRNELVKADRVVNSGTRRETKRGRTAIVWRAVRKAAAKTTTKATAKASTKTTAKKPAARTTTRTTATRRTRRA